MRTHALVLAGAALLAACARERPRAAGEVEGKPGAPLQLQLQGRADGDRLVLEATVLARRSLASAPVLRLELPEGAVLEAGAREEQLAAAPSTSRSWVVKGATGPVRVLAEAAAKGAGARAEAQWPPAKVVPKPRMAAEPIAPVKVHGVNVQEAVPLER